MEKGKIIGKCSSEEKNGMGALPIRSLSLIGSKGVSVYISWVIVLVIVITGITLVLTSGLPVIETSRSSLALAEAEQFFGMLDSSIREVAQEGIGSSRLVRVPIGEYALIDNGAEFRTIGSELEPLSRRIVGNIALFGGSDVTCQPESFGGTPAYRLENTFIKAYLRSGNGTINTQDNILTIQSKYNNLTITPSDSSIIIDGLSTSSSGTGFTELRRQGSGMPLCRVRYFVNSTAGKTYDIFYTLYNGADFLQVEIRNIK